MSYLIASKIAAFHDPKRGNSNFYMSHDLEDIILLLDGCPTLEAEINAADEKVKKFIKGWFKNNRISLKEAAPAQLSFTARNSGREQRLLSLIEKLAKSS